MGVMLDSSGELCLGKVSGFQGVSCIDFEYFDGIPFPIQQIYYDTYLYGFNIAGFHRRILGDATGEMGPFSDGIGSWYEDKSLFLYFEYPWHKVGGSFQDGNECGLFSFYREDGLNRSYIGYRIVFVL